MILQLLGVGHGFPGQPELFSQVSFEAASGEMVALTGPSGSGKSTLLAMIAGWLMPRDGEIKRLDSHKLAWVPQNPYGVSRRAALDHVVLPFLVRGIPRSAAESAARRHLEAFGIERVASTPFSRLSGGEAQRLMLARAVSSQADLILVDEPTAQLDPTSATAVAEVLGQLCREGAVVVIATHDPRVTEICSKQVRLGTR